MKPLFDIIFSKAVCFFVVSLLALNKGYAQNGVGLSQPIFSKIDRTNGISNNRTNSVIKEPNGFVFNRFDIIGMSLYPNEIN